jgi:PAS domain S-box-containing protein
VTASSPVLGGDVVDGRLRWVFRAASALVIALLVSLVTRRTGSYYAPVDGWGVALFELAMGAVCIGRYFDGSWQSSQSVTRVFPLVLGAGAILWGLGDVAFTVESLGGATPAVPSVADAFYLSFFPLCFISFIMVIRRGNGGSLLATSLDGIIAALAVASVCAACVFSTVLRVAGGSELSAATNMMYPVGDLLLLALAVGGITILPRDYRRFLVIATTAMAVNLTGNTFNLLQPNSKLGYVCNAVAWPISLLMLATATWAQPVNARARPVNAYNASTEKTAGFTFPVLGALASMAIFVSASAGHVGRVALSLATATLVVVAVRLVFTVRRAHALDSARFRSLVDNAWDMIVVAEVDFQVAYITPSSQRVLGYAPGELQGSPVTGLVHPDDTGSMLDHLRQLAEGTTEVASFETRMRHRNGVWRTIAWTATDLRKDPSVRGYVLNGGDVTEARHAAKDLAAARDGALMASKAKSDFLSTMSHEIRTPMNGVIGLTELLLETSLDPDQHELASGVKVSAENLLVIINDILDFSKIEAGKLDLEEVALDVAEVADNVGRILAGTAHAKGLELLVDIHPGVPRSLLGDRVRLQQVLLNLGSNAVKFTTKGEVVLRASVLDWNTKRVALRFEVIDMGIGIAAADQQRLFQAFSQTDSSTTRKFGGTGLGLAICRQLVGLMGGKIGVISAPGEGSTFWFELSLRRCQTTPPPEAAGKAGDLAGQRALIVDDNSTNRRILRQQLTSWGVEVLEAVDSYEALELVAGAARAGKTFNFGVIDLNMPGMGGMELAEILKAHPETATIALFLLSSSGGRLGTAEAHVRGFAGSLTKPVRPSELFDCLITGLNSGAPPVPAEGPQTDRPEPQEAKGMILLVEDNQMNQLVGSKVLAKLGYAFDVANHGGEAVSAIQARTYDAVLMDCQMPEMDGYQATAEIRRIEGTARRTPIIAMTAAAMDGDREMCLAAGMDDYITKPVRLEAIAAVLERWAGRPVPDEPEAGAVGPAPGGALPDPLDQAQIELLSSLDDGEGAVLREIIDQYLAQTVEGRGDLVRAIGQGDAQALERAAHKLRGASANVGAVVLAEICSELEAQGRAARLEGAAGLVERFDAEFTRVGDALHQVATWDLKCAS